MYSVVSGMVSLVRLLGILLRLALNLPHVERKFRKSILLQAMLWKITYFSVFNCLANICANVHTCILYSGYFSSQVKFWTVMLCTKIKCSRIILLFWKLLPSEKRVTDFSE